jgi:hypothetical protein
MEDGRHDPPSERELREWETLRSYSDPGPEVVRRIVRTAFPVLLDNRNRLAEEVERLKETYVPQDVAAECIERLKKALDGPPEEQANTLWDMVHEVCERYERMFGFFAHQSFDLDDDPNITCVFCGKEGCDASFVTRAGGVTAGHGLHIDCRKAARKLLRLW